MRATGHCAHPLPLVAAGMDAKEHVGFCAARGDGNMYDDMRPALPGGRHRRRSDDLVLDFAVRSTERPAVLDEDPEAAPFMPARDAFSGCCGWGPAGAECAASTRCAPARRRSSSRAPA